MPLSWLTFVSVKTSEAARRAALDAPPIEALTAAEDPSTFVAGGRQTKGALPIATPKFEAAVYSSRGRGYARYNEDGGALYFDGRGRVYAAVFDQAGGLGGTVRGAASELAAQTAFDSFRSLAQNDDDDVSGRLRGAIDEAHKALVARSEGEVTTAVLLVAAPERTIVVNSGDSAAVWFDGAGQFKAMTNKHELQSPLGVGCLVHALGLVPEGPAADAYDWPVAPGDWVLMGSDGLLDAGLTWSSVGATLARAASPEVAVNQLARLILRRMTLLQAKPDNLTIIALRAVDDSLR